MLSHDIANLSSGPYYRRPYDWYKMLEKILTKYQCKPEPMLEIHSHKGKGFISYSGREKGQVFFSWYRLPITGWWEIVSYKC